MPGIGTIWKFFQYLPVIMEVSKAILPKEPEVRPDTATHEDLDDFKKQLNDRISELESEQTRLRARIRELETSLNWLRTLLYIGLGASFVLILIFLIIVLVRH